MFQGTRSCPCTFLSTVYLQKRHRLAARGAVDASTHTSAQRTQRACIRQPVHRLWGFPAGAHCSEALQAWNAQPLLGIWLCRDSSAFQLSKCATKQSKLQA